jgi:hypothetical protein
MPDWKSHIRPHLAPLRLSPVRENEIIDELAQHLDDRWGELIAGGASEEEAMRLALTLLRDTTLVRNLAPLRQSLQPPPATLGVSTASGSRAWPSPWDPPLTNCRPTATTARTPSAVSARAHRGTRHRPRVRQSRSGAIRVPSSDESCGRRGSRRRGTSGRMPR